MSRQKKRPMLHLIKIVSCNLQEAIFLVAIDYAHYCSNPRSRLQLVVIPLSCGILYTLFHLLNTKKGLLWCIIPTISLS